MLLVIRESATGPSALRLGGCSRPKDRFVKL